MTGFHLPTISLSCFVPGGLTLSCSVTLTLLWASGGVWTARAPGRTEAGESCVPSPFRLQQWLLFPAKSLSNSSCSNFSSPRALITSFLPLVCLLAELRTSWCLTLGAYVPRRGSVWMPFSKISSAEPGGSEFWFRILFVTSFLVTQVTYRFSQFPIFPLTLLWCFFMKLFF